MRDESLKIRQNKQTNSGFAFRDDIEHTQKNVDFFRYFRVKHSEFANNDVIRSTFQWSFQSGETCECERAYVVCSLMDTEQTNRNLHTCRWRCEDYTVRTISPRQTTCSTNLTQRQRCTESQTERGREREGEREEERNEKKSNCVRKCRAAESETIIGSQFIDHLSNAFDEARSAMPINHKHICDANRARLSNCLPPIWCWTHLNLFNLNISFAQTLN